MALAEKVKITINSTAIKDYLNLNLQQNIFGHHTLEIVCRREDAFEEENTFILDKADKKFLGCDLSLMITVPGNKMVEFKGIVTELKASKLNDTRSDTIIIKASSPDILLDDGEHCRTFEEKTIKSIVEKILKEYQLDNNCVKPIISNDPQPYIVQYKESAFAFLTRLASKKGQWFYYDGAEIIFGSRKEKKTDLNFGVDLFNFNFSVKLDDLKFKYLAYDYINNVVVNSDSSDKKIAKLSDKAHVAYDTSEKKFKHETLSLYNHTLEKSKEQSHLDSRVKLIKSAITAGFISLYGSSDNADIVLGGEIKINETSREENKKKINHGSYIVTSISHSCERSGNYQNSFSAIPVEIEVPPFSSPHAIPFCETQIAKVMDNNDPDKLGRIRVQFVWQEPENAMTPWIRIVSPHAGNEKGFYFIPEIGEEVLVAFEGGNAEKPYVTGSMYHGKAKPDAKWVNDKDDIKAIRTRSGHTIEFVDTDGKEELKIYDFNKENYIITLASHSSKITIESKGDIEMEAKGDIKIKAQNIKMESGQDMNIKASKMKIDGGSQLEQSAGIVKIN